MCGLVGLCSRSKLQNHEILFSRKLMKELNHRGPDQKGEYKKDNIFLGMQRLSIQGIQDGQQPFFSPDKKISLIANGEIYNFLEIKEKLIKKGYKFQTKSDCEVLIALYFYYGLDFLNTEEIRGMFAFILYDNKKKILVCGRDRFGEKPLYYFEDKNKFLFSSELRSMANVVDCRLNINKTAVNDFFHFGFINEPNTIFSEINKIEAGSIMILNTIDFKKKTIFYSDFFKTKKYKKKNFDKIFEKELFTVGMITTRSEAKIGIALSGGLDSNLIAALGSKYRSDLEAINVTYKNSNNNIENSIARYNSKKLGMKFHSCFLSDNEMLKNFKKLILFRDEPIADISGSSYLKIMQVAKAKRFKVILLGQGSDEIFWGYPWLKQVFNVNKYYLNKNFFWKPYLYYCLIPKSLDITVWIDFAKNFFFVPRFIFLVKNLKKNKFLFYELNRDYFIFHKNKKDFYGENFYREVNNQNPSNNFVKKFKKIKNFKIHFINLIFKSYLLQNGIVQSDRLSMSQNIEARLPLLDYIFVNLCLSFAYMINSKNYLFLFFKKHFSFLKINKKKIGFEVPNNWSKVIFKKYNYLISNGALIRLGILNKNFSSFGNFRLKIIILEIWLRDYFSRKKISLVDI
jgi:asparagine synthase (glutamine-hydrolysing)